MVVGGDGPFAECLCEYDSHHALIGRKVSVSVNDGEPPLMGAWKGLMRWAACCCSRNTLHHIISGQVHHGY